MAIVALWVPWVVAIGNGVPVIGNGAENGGKLAAMRAIGLVSRVITSRCQDTGNQWWPVPNGRGWG